MPTPELTGHSLIEFSNRLMSPVLGLLALALVVVLWRNHPERRGLRALSFIILGGIVAQAVVGGVTVLTGLNAAIVAFHFLVSAALVGISAALTVLVYEPLGERVRAIPRWLAGITHASTGVLFVVAVLGTITTANGPHSGDAAVIREGNLWSTFVEFHAVASYLLLALVVVIVIGALRVEVPRRYRNWSLTLLGTLVLQIIVGISQARLGIPGGLVAIHMILAGLMIAAGTATLMYAKATVGVDQTDASNASSD